jgi:decaprenylphospho-beta-D-erythro-pentofuranosid-2-ulose 2-reductase
MNEIISPALIIGAKSDIGRALARRYAEAGCDVILAARRVDALENARADLEVRHGVRAFVVECDVMNPDPDGFFATLPEIPGTIVMVAGLLGDQTDARADTAIAKKVMETNYVGPALFLLAGARILEGRGGGCVIGISSVAGDRGRASNYIYGSGKAGLTAFLSGLRSSVAKKGVNVITVKPGYVATQMTAGMKLPKLLTAQPDEVATAILRAQRRGTDILYIKRVWQLIMIVITLIPERIFKRLPL